MTGLAELAAQALVSASLIRGVDPVKVFEQPAPLGRGGARLLAALWLERRVGRTTAMRLCRIGTRQQFAPSQWANQGVSARDVQAMDTAMRKLGMAEADAAEVASRRTNMPRPMVCEPEVAAPQALRLPPQGPVVPAIRASRRVGKPAPRRPDPRIEAIGRSPADIAADGHEVRFVRERRARTPPMPWSQIAKQLGNKTEHDLRRVYDPAYVAPSPATGVGTPPCTQPLKLNLTEAQRRALRTIRASDCLGTVAVAAALGVTRQSAAKVLDQLEVDGLAMREGTRGAWQPTPLGRQVAA